jgi:hypothetical protein
MKTSAQETFESPQLLDGCGNLAQPFRERRASPDLFQTDRALKKQVGALAEQPRKTSRLDQNPDHLFHIRRIHYPISRSRTYDDGSRKVPVCLSILSAVGEIPAGQIEDDLHAAIGQNAFAVVGKSGCPAVPHGSNP